MFGLFSKTETPRARVDVPALDSDVLDGFEPKISDYWLRKVRSGFYGGKFPDLFNPKATAHGSWGAFPDDAGEEFCRRYGVKVSDNGRLAFFTSGDRRFVAYCAWTVLENRQIVIMGIIVEILPDGSERQTFTTWTTADGFDDFDRTRSRAFRKIAERFDKDPTKNGNGW